MMNDPHTLHKFYHFQHGCQINFELELRKGFRLEPASMPTLQNFKQFFSYNQ